jgi:hypothetical protein
MRLRDGKPGFYHPGIFLPWEKKKRGVILRNEKVISLLLFASPLLFGSLAVAADSDTQDVYCELKPITVFSVSGTLGPLIIDQANPSEDPQPVTDGSTWHNFSNTVPNKKIVGKINSAMPQ